MNKIILFEMRKKSGNLKSVIGKVNKKVNLRVLGVSPWCSKGGIPIMLGPICITISIIPRKCCLDWVVDPKSPHWFHSTTNLLMSQSHWFVVALTLGSMLYLDL